LNNSGVLTVTGVTNDGSVAIENIGAMTLDGPVRSTGSTVEIWAHSPLTTNADADVTAFGNVTLFAGANNSTLDNLTVNSNITSLHGNVLLKAGELVIVDNITLPSSDNVIGNSFLTAAPQTGRVIVIDNLNATLLPQLTTQSSALLPAVSGANNSWIATMGREATDLTEENKENTDGEGGQHGTEFRSLPYCN
jgi:hypothetical protein